MLVSHSFLSNTPWPKTTGHISCSAMQPCSSPHTVDGCSALDGALLSKSDGALLGVSLGALLGILLGALDGSLLGASDGVLLGALDGSLLGASDGVLLGRLVGNSFWQLVVVNKVTIKHAVWHQRRTAAVL